MWQVLHSTETAELGCLFMFMWFSMASEFNDPWVQCLSEHFCSRQVITILPTTSFWGLVFLNVAYWDWYCSQFESAQELGLIIKYFFFFIIIIIIIIIIMLIHYFSQASLLMKLQSRKQLKICRNAAMVWSLGWQSTKNNNCSLMMKRLRRAVWNPATSETAIVDHRNNAGD